jgi:Mycolic acid cyclopropane synthetase
MADREDLEFTYSLIDRIFRLSLGELADFSGAKYDGDFSFSLEEAQRRKHEYVAEQIDIGRGRRVLDIGCGWGPLLNFIRNTGGTGVGVTLSSAQVAACRRHGLDVHLYDAREVTRDSFGAFDAVASVGGFEHFCSPDDYLAGRQEEIYRAMFAGIARRSVRVPARPPPRRPGARPTTPRASSWLAIGNAGGMQGHREDSRHRVGSSPHRGSGSASGCKNARMTHIRVGHPARSGKGGGGFKNRGIRLAHLKPSGCGIGHAPDLRG